MSIPATRPGLLTVMAKILLNDPDTGLEFADLDGTHITDYRTGAAGGVAVQYLARLDATRLGLIGAGAQARTQVAAILKVRSVQEIVVFDRHREHAQAFAAEVGAAYGVKVRATSAAAEAVTGQDIVVTNHPHPDPGGGPGVGVAGDHINAVGADAAGKQELAPAILTAAKVVVDDWAQASHSGEINVPLARGELTPGQVYGSLEILWPAISRAGGSEEITVFDSTGLIIQDLALGWRFTGAPRKGVWGGEGFLEIRIGGRARIMQIGPEIPALSGGLPAGWRLEFPQGGLLGRVLVVVLAVAEAADRRRGLGAPRIRASWSVT